MAASAHRHLKATPAPDDVRPVSRSELIAASLSAGRLEMTQLMSFTAAAATPLTVVSGVMTAGYAATGLLGLPLAFLLIGVVLAVFTVGFAAMSRHITNAGAFYAYIAHGLSRRLAVGAAWVALAAYNLLACGLYGIIGIAADPLAQRYLGAGAPWWMYALAGWALTAVMGVLHIDVQGRLVTVLLLAEVTLIVVCSLASLAAPGPQGLSTQALSPSSLTGLGSGGLLVLALAVLGYVGFESAPVYSEEIHDSAPTVRAAMYWTVGLSCAVYVLAAWAMSVATGPSHIVTASTQHGPELFFILASERLGPLVADIGHILLLTSITAALVAFHATVARYAFALGREHVLPQAFGRIWTRTGAPVTASIAQSSLGLTVIIVAAAWGVDPLTQLFYLFGTSGGIGVLALLTITSIAVVVFFARTQHHKTPWTAVIAPTLAALALAAVLAVALTHLDGLLGIPPGHPLTWIIPAGLALLLTAGTWWGHHLRQRRPQVFAAIGHGVHSARTRADLAAR